MVIGPQTYVRSVSTEINPTVPGIDVDAAAGTSASTVADLAGYRGAIVTVYFTPVAGAIADASFVTLKHGATSVYSAHTDVSSDANWGFLEDGSGAGGAEKSLTFLVDTSRVERYLSVMVDLNLALLCFMAASITPIGPKVAKSSNVDRTNDLFISSSGALTFPDLS